MKCLFILSLLLLPLINLSAQDIIIMKSGEEIKAKVTEITPKEIKYKEYDNQEGPLMVVERQKVFQIRYQNGSVETFPKVDVPKSPEQDVPPAPKAVKLGGPRIGVSVVDAQVKERIDHLFNKTTAPFYSQFGWQFETRFFTLPDGFSGVFEVVPLIGGFEQGLFLPSLSTLIGVRTGGGFEFGAGPNLSLSGIALVLAAGVTFQSEYVNFPVNFGVVPSGNGMRYTLLVGFNRRSY